MVALARSGRPVEAMRSYDRFRRRLADEVGVVPSRSLQRLNDDILRQAPGTEWDHTGPDAPMDAPADAAAGLERLPRTVTSFVGRAAELAELVGALHARGLTTVCGPGGVGKTRLAIEAARAFATAGGSREGVWWCDLAPVPADADDAAGDGVAAAVAAALGLVPEPGVALRERILGFLAGRELTLVIDNCEHVAGSVAHLAGGIRQHAPGVGVLATSREPLAIEGERVVDLEPLAADAAVRLFADRAAAVRGGFGVDADNAVMVVQICQRLDGMPLAIELAAGRLASVGVADLARLLDDRFRVLVTSRRDASDRHRTLRAAIDSSYDALSAGDQAVFERLAVFPASFGLEATEAVCAGGAVTSADVLEVLSRLVARSLVVAEPDAHGAVRYRLLETLRAYAHERLAERGDGDGDADAARPPSRRALRRRRRPGGVADHRPRRGPLADVAGDGGAQPARRRPLGRRPGRPRPGRPRVHAVAHLDLVRDRAHRRDRALGRGPGAPARHRGAPRVPRRLRVGLPWGQLGR